VIGGKKVDLRKPDEVHRAALERATGKTVSLLERAAGNVSEPTRTAIRRTLATLPGDEQAGRLTREPEPAGFSMFAGVTPRAAKAAPPTPAARNHTQENDATQNQRNQAKERRAAQQEQQRAELARQRAEKERVKALANARKEMKDAQQAAERATFALRKAEAEVAKVRAAETKAANRLKETETRLAELLKA
jgi:chromosome segregation ATPase